MFRRKAITIAICIALSFVVLSCQKISDQTSGGQIKTDTLPSFGTIPLDYGNLVAVTTAGTVPRFAQLWFEKPDKSIVVVKVDYDKNVLNNTVLMIPRK